MDGAAGKKTICQGPVATGNLFAALTVARSSARAAPALQMAREDPLIVARGAIEALAILGDACSAKPLKRLPIAF